MDFNIYNLNYRDKERELVVNNTGVVKSTKVFPIYKKDDKEYLFKPLSKTKPLTTFLFAYSEVFWSNIINKYFDSNSPIYHLALCNGYSDKYPNRYDKGTIVENVIKENEYLKDLLLYYKKNKDKNVNIDNYINYCGMFYDYTDILKSKVFEENKNLGGALSRQILISILKCDLNFHYENVSFIYKDKEIKSLSPPIDHEFSLFFLFPDDSYMYNNYFGKICSAFIFDNYNDNTCVYNIIKNIKLIAMKYPNVLDEFIDNLDCFINEFSKSLFILENNQFNEPISSELYQVYEKIYKDHNGSNGEKNIEDIKFININLEEKSKEIQQDIITISNIYLDYLKKLNINNSKGKYYGRKRIN